MDGKNGGPCSLCERNSSLVSIQLPVRALKFFPPRDTRSTLQRERKWSVDGIIVRVYITFFLSFVVEISFFRLPVMERSSLVFFFTRGCKTCTRTISCLYLRLGNTMEFMLFFFNSSTHRMATIFIMCSINFFGVSTIDVSFLLIKLPYIPTRAKNEFC